VWSTVSEVYPSHLSLSQAPQGSVLVVEPKVIREVHYRPVQPPAAPYELTTNTYSRRLWIC